MPVPTYDALIQPTLLALHDLNGLASLADIERCVVARLQLSEADVALPHGTTTQTELSYRLAWARTYLKNFGVVERVGGGVWRLTDMGRELKTVDPHEVKRASASKRLRRKTAEQPLLQAEQALEVGIHRSNLLDAIRDVLHEAGRPLHARTITERLLARQWWKEPPSKPIDSVTSGLAVDIKTNGNKSEFVRTAPNTFALRVPLQNSQELRVSEEARVQPEPLTFLTAAFKVLSEHANFQPMHYRSITEIAVREGWLMSQGQTPEATLYSQVLQDINRHERKGGLSRFTKHGRGLVGLTGWLSPGLVRQLERNNAEVRDRLHARLHAMHPAAFEQLVGSLLEKLGFQVGVTKPSGDGGIDVRGTLVVGGVIRTRMAVQVKRWKQNIQAPIVQQVRGSLGAHEQGLIITTSNFSKGARDEAERRDAVPVALMDGGQLVGLLIEHEVGVTKTQLELYELPE